MRFVLLMTLLEGRLKNTISMIDWMLGKFFLSGKVEDLVKGKSGCRTTSWAGAGHAGLMRWMVLELRAWDNHNHNHNR